MGAASTTKLRTPLSFEEAIHRVIGLLGADAAAQAIGKDPRSLRRYADPDADRPIPIVDALKLDAAYIAAGGESAPLYEVYVHQLRCRAYAIPACSAELAMRTARAAKEGGEAIAALIRGNLPGATNAERALALHEAREGRDALDAVLPVLGSIITAGGCVPADTS